MCNMTLVKHQLDHRACLSAAARLLGGAARAVDLDTSLAALLTRHLVFEGREGIAGPSPLMRFASDRRGHELAYGVERYRLDSGAEAIRVARVVAPRDYDASEACYEFWAVLEVDYRRLYKFLRTLVRKQHDHAAPIMRPRDRQRLWDNSVGFLRHRCKMLLHYGLPQRRGLLLLGQPGNGKTMACRWLRSQCQRYGLDWRSVSADEYQSNVNDSDAHELFKLARPGIVFFDDVDIALRDRDRFGTSQEQAVLLGALDGIDREHGVVYLFTSNATLSDIDPAFRRPGRIDTVLHFPHPDRNLRRQLVEKTWHAEIRAALDIDAVLAVSQGFSFAELEEFRRLMVLGFLESGRWDSTRAWQLFSEGRAVGWERPKIGFASATAKVPAGAKLPTDFPFAPLHSVHGKRCGPSASSTQQG